MLNNIDTLFNTNIALTLRLECQKEELSNRLNNGTPIERKIADYFGSSKVKEIIPNNWGLKFTPLEIIINIDKMVQLLKKSVLSEDIFWNTAGDRMKKRYMNDIISCLFLLKCHYDNLLKDNDMFAICLKNKAQKHIKDMAYYTNLNRAIFGKDAIFANQYQVNEIQSDIDNLKKKVEDVEGTAQQAQKTAQKTAKVVLNGLHPNTTGYKDLQSDIERTNNEQCKGFDSFPNELKSLIEYGAISMGIISKENDKFIWLLKGSDLGYFANEIKNLYGITQKAVVDIMYHRSNGTLKQYANVCDLVNKSNEKPNEKIITILEPIKDKRKSNKQ